MLKQFANRHNLVLKKGQNLHILFTLAINYLLLWKLRLYKRMKGIKHPIVHYYAVCWNEEKMLPFMFDYYDQFVDHYTVYDNCSTDKSEEIIRSHKSAKIIKFSTDGFNDQVHIDIKNNCWKKSRGKADYVVVCDMDEFIYHPQIKEFFSKSVKNGDTFFYPVGYDMYCDKYPSYSKGALLPTVVNYGVQCDTYSKCILFDPHRVVEVNYWLGAHEARPLGIIKKLAIREPLKVLHYKNLGLDYVLDRIRQYRGRLSQENINNECGVEYLKEDKRIISDFQIMYQSCTKIDYDS